MTLDVSRSWRRGFERAAARNGLVLILLFALLGILGQAIGAGVSDQLMGSLEGDLTGAGVNPNVPSHPLALDVSPVVLGVLSIILALAQLVLMVVAIRLFLSEEMRSFEMERYTDGLLLPVANLLVGGIVFSFIVSIGLAFFVLPGLFLFVSLLYFAVVVVDEDSNFIEGFSDSWRLTSGNRLRVFGLVAGIVIIGLVVSALSALLTFATSGIIAVVVAVVQQLFASFITVFGIASVVESYKQLVADG
jgi:hypothetical protein